jgi:FkbM family methyltransferase
VYHLDRVSQNVLAPEAERRSLLQRARSELKVLARYLVLKAATRVLLNMAYQALSLEKKAKIHARFGRLFWKADQRIDSGIWKVRFLERSVRMPLAGEDLYISWALALSLLGHDIDVKRTYEELLSDPSAPMSVFDVGANYGLHSILFLIHGISTISFEPNPRCHEYFKRLAALNGVEPNLQPVAVGALESQIELRFPISETWLGTTDPEVASQLARNFATGRTVVTQTTIDRFVALTGCIPDLIKIDVEGTELQVLQGAAGTLTKYRPLVVFECWRESRRWATFDLLQELDYCVLPLPFGLGRTSDRATSAATLSLQQFLASESTNFAALDRRLPAVRK